MLPITSSSAVRWRIPPVEWNDAYPPLGSEPVSGFIYRAGDRLEQIPYLNPEITPGRYVIVPYPNGTPDDAREIHYSGVQRLVSVGAHWLPTICVEGQEFYLLGRREQFLHNQTIVARVLIRLGRRFLVWVAYCWRTETYRYALSTPHGTPMGSGHYDVRLPTSPGVDDENFHRAQDELADEIVGGLLDRILSWEPRPVPNLLSHIVSRIPSVVNGTEAYTRTPNVGIATPPAGWASWSTEEDYNFLDRFGRAWMRGESIPCGRMSR